MIQHEPLPDALALVERRLPPITEVAMATMILIVIGGIYMAAQIPGDVSLAPAVALLAVAGVLVLVDLLLLSRIGPFAWRIFRIVFGWALLAYLVIAGMIEYAFVTDGTRGAPLVVLSLMLLVYAVDIPLILAFSVARYQEPDPARE